MCQFYRRIQTERSAAAAPTCSGVPTELPRIQPTVSLLMHGRGHFKRSAMVPLEAVALSLRTIYRPGERRGTSDGEYRAVNSFQTQVVHAPLSILTPRDNASR